MELTQCALLNKISEIQFVCVELNLYIDTHPDDEAAKADFLCYAKKLRELLDKYNECYGPLMNFGHSPSDMCCYVCGAWPF